jgi:hypothetical protein
MNTDATRPHFLIYFDDVPSKHSLEAVGDDWGNVEALAMHTGDNELRCDRIKIEKIETQEVREYLRNHAGIWYRRNV